MSYPVVCSDILRWLRFFSETQKNSCIWLNENDDRATLFFVRWPFLSFWLFCTASNSSPHLFALTFDPAPIYNHGTPISEFIDWWEPPRPQLPAATLPWGIPPGHWCSDRKWHTGNTVVFYLCVCNDYVHLNNFRKHMCIGFYHGMICVSPVTLGLLWIPPDCRSSRFPCTDGNRIYQVNNTDTKPDSQRPRADIPWGRPGGWWLLRHLLAGAVRLGCTGAGSGLATATAQLCRAHRGHHSGQPLRPRHAKHQGAGQETHQECTPSK